MLSRLGPRCPRASVLAFLYPIVQTVVVEHNLAGNQGIKPHEEYSALCSASLDAEVTLLARMQEKLQKNMGIWEIPQGYGGLRNGILQERDLATRPQQVLNHVKWTMFQRAAGTFLMETLL